MPLKVVSKASKQSLKHFYKYLSQSDTCQLESVLEKTACTLSKTKQKTNSADLANKLKFNDYQDNVSSKPFNYLTESIIIYFHWWLLHKE